MRELTFSCCYLYLRGILAAVTANDSLAHKVRIHTQTHTHTRVGPSQDEHATSEGQYMERWKVTPPDTDPTPSSPLCIPCSQSSRTMRGMMRYRHTHIPTRVPIISHVSSQHALMSQVDAELKSHPLHYIVRQMSAAVRRAPHFPADGHASRM